MCRVLFLAHSFWDNSGVIETQSASELCGTRQFYTHTAVITPKVLVSDLLHSLTLASPLIKWW